MRLGNACWKSCGEGGSAVYARREVCARTEVEGAVHALTRSLKAVELESWHGWPGLNDQVKHSQPVLSLKALHIQVRRPAGPSLLPSHDEPNLGISRVTGSPPASRQII
jgi:hypothetical protein